jgi:hypothetical protein
LNTKIRPHNRILVGICVILFFITPSQNEREINSQDNVIIQISCKNCMISFEMTPKKSASELPKYSINSVIKSRSCLDSLTIFVIIESAN